MEQFDFMSLLGLEKAEPKKEAKEVKKAKTETKKEDKKAAKTVSTASMVGLPCTVVFGPENAVQLTKEMFDGALSVESNKVLEFVKKNYLIPTAPYKLLKLGDNRILVCPDRAKEVPALSVKLGENDILYVGKETYAASEISEQVSDFLKHEYPVVSFSFIKTENGFLAIPEDKTLKAVSFPLTVYNLVGEDIVLKAEDFKKAADESESEAEDTSGDAVGEDEEGADSEDAAQNAEITVTVDDVVEKLVTDYYPDCKGAIKLVQSLIEEEGMCHAVVTFSDSSVASGANKAPAKKETTYPSDCIISLITRRIQLSPEMFGGKEQLKENDILKFLSADYPEYTKARTIFSYDEETKILVPLIKGSDKGATLYPSFEAALAAATNEEYFLGLYEEHGRQFRMEKTFISLTCAGEQSRGGMFEFYLPKVPAAIIQNVHDFFIRVMKQYDTEALVWICFNRMKSRYEIIIPRQQVSHVSVNSEDVLPESADYFKVIDFHSHGCINCPFSAVDNANEKGNHIFGVSLNLARDGQRLWRAGTGGKYVLIKEGDFVTAQEPDYAVPTPTALFEAWCKVAEVN